MFVLSNPIRIHDNTVGGIEIDAGLGIMLGTTLVDAIKVDTNGGDGIAVAAGVAHVSGVTVSGNTGRGVVFDLTSTGALGDDDTMTSGVTESGNSGGGVVLSHGSIVAGLTASTFTALTCDESSWVIGTFVAGPTNTCPLDNPRGGIGPQGLPGTNGTNGVDGAQGLPGQNGTDGAPGVSGRVTITATGPTTVAKATSATVPVTCTSPKVPLGGGGATNNANLVMISSGPTATGWSVTFRNIASNNQAGLVLTATAVCATALP